ncbi:TetR family transcriptional regulator [Actinomadura rupiterrae]|uniref:TetR family transcriptional regulator n=1 Tax=Actinomadura rupiterrae TaxID=559627 RepID=UPI0020A37790|nr:TetR family transcriptional regulator [Actinomadura rupiterrae]MCP2341830.1 AcrR family transcriptional regulator [Actinomadura rupiterrae]
MSVAESGPRARRVARTRAALAAAALEIVAERGFRALTVQEIADRAGVSRRTFSRYFAGREDALVEPVRDDCARINAALAARPADERPVVAYRNAVLDWLGSGAPHEARAELLRTVHAEAPAEAAYQRVIAAAEDRTAEIFADRLGADDLRPVVLAAACAGALRAAIRWWQEHPEEDGGPQESARRAFDVLAAELGGRA